VTTHQPPDGQVADAEWRRRLAEGFAALLGRPLDEFDPGAVYAAFFGGDFIYELEYHRDEAWLDPEALAGRALIEDTPFILYDQGEAPLRFDAAGSVFEFTDASALPADFAAALTAACFSDAGPGPGLIRGRDLGALLARHGVDLTEERYASCWSVCHARIASDGTLLDALRAATGIGDGPDSLVAYDGEAAKELAELIAAVPDPELRAHLTLGCQEPGSADGLCYMGAEGSGSPVLEDEGCEQLACWEDGSGQVDVAVVRLSDIAAGPA
jgi:hypothetical protein